MPAPLICYDNILRASTVTVVSEDTETGNEFANCIDGGTWSKMGLLSGATRDVVIGLGGSTSFNYFCAANHNLSGSTLVIAGSNDNSSYTDIQTINFTNNTVQAIEITQSSYSYVRFRFSGMAGTVYIADMWLGVALEIPEGVPVGFVPPEQYDDDEIRTNITGAGALAAIDVKTNPKKCQFDLKDIESSWFSANWVSLLEGMKQYPAYFLWADGQRTMYFVFDRKPRPPKFTTNARQSSALYMKGFVE